MKSDSAILQRILKGDRRAVNEFYGLYVKALYNFAYYRVGKNHHLAEEATNDIFHFAIQRLGQYDSSRGEVYTWLVNIGRRVVTDILRRERRWRRQETAWQRIDEQLLEVYQSMDEGKIPDEMLESEETREIVNIAMSQLPLKYKNLIEQRYWRDTSVAELARKMRVSGKAVESMLWRARRAFKKTFLIVAGESEWIL